MAKKKETLGMQSLAKHKKFGGKLEVVSKVPLKTKKDWSMYYTPGVAAVSTHVAKNPKDAYVYSIKKNTVAVVSDGSAVLGLGNIGPYGALPVMEGKAAIFKSLANVDAFPIVLDTQDPEEIIQTVIRIAPAFGGINLEDISAPNCFYIEEELKKKLSIPVMHDDQHGTAIVVLAGMINAFTVVGRKLNSSDTWITVAGVGAAGVATMKFIHRFAPKVNILAVDSQGIVWKGRKELSETKKKLIKEKVIFAEEGGDLAQALVDADAFIGVSKPNLVSAKIIRTMKKDSIIFALSNPNPEVLPHIAKKGGAAVVATGRSDFPNQVNNALVFPGIFRGALDKGVRTITDDMKIRAAVALANLVKKPTADAIIPPVMDPRVVKTIAKAI